MSGLRDARLKRALESAPDADARPDPRVRRAVLDAARQAVAPPRVAWWRMLWQGLGDRNMPWNAALATVALATLVTVLWHDQETPDARPGSPASVAPAPVIAVPPATSMTQAPPPVSPPAPPATPSRLAEGPAARKAAPVAKPQQPQPKLQQLPQQPPREAAPAPSPSFQAEAARERRTDVAAQALRDQSRGELAKSGPAPQAADAAAPAESAAAGARAPAAAAAPAPQAMSRPAPAGLASQLARTVAGWTQARVESQGRSIELARDQAPRLAALMDAIVRAPPGQESLQAPVTARVEFRRGAEPAGTLELAAGQVRWRGAGRVDSATIQVDAALVQAAQDEISALLPR